MSGSPLPAQPSLSILITYYNERGMLTDCLKTVASQIEQSDEIIIFDDCSDEPPEQYIPAEIAVRVIKSDVTRGPAFGRNRLLAAARRQYVHFHDADDWFHPQWWSKVREALTESGADVVFTEVASTSGAAPTFHNEVLGISALLEQRDLVRYCLRGSLLTPSGTYRRDLLLSLGGYDERQWQAEDFEFHVRLAASEPHYQIILEPLIAIRIRPDSRSCRRREVWEGALQAVSTLRDLLPPVYQNELADAAARAASQLHRLGDSAAARRGFRLAHEVGRPSFGAEHQFYSSTARVLGPSIAEQLGSLYRLAFPGEWRRWVRRLLQ